MIEALLSPEGRALLDELSGADRLDDLRLATALRERYETDLVAAAMTQAELRRAATAKFTRAAEMFFTRPGLEQASAEPIARHRATRFAGRQRIADLCTGIGGDLIALAPDHDVTAVDVDPVHLRMAQLNTRAYGESATFTQADVRTFDLHGVDAAFVDPARRTGERRLRPGDSEPPLGWCLGVAGTVPVAIKLAPGVERAGIPSGWELEFVADRRELKEATAWSPALATVARRATVLPGGDTLVPDGAGEPVPVREPGAYLLDPNPAVTRAGLVEELARATGTWKIDAHIAFLCSDTPVRTPFARMLRVLESAPWQERHVAARLRALGIGAVDIRRRGLAGNVEQLHRRLKLRGGPKATLVMTRMQGAPWSLVCVD